MHLPLENKCHTDQFMVDYVQCIRGCINRKHTKWASEYSAMSRVEFTEALREQWKTIVPDNVAYTELLRLQLPNDLQDGQAIFDSPRWSVVAHRTMLELLNRTGLTDLLQQVRGITELAQVNSKFGSQSWFYILYGRLYRMYSFGRQFVPLGQVGDFFLRLTVPQRTDYARYIERYMANGYPVFSQTANDFLRRQTQNDIDKSLPLAQRARRWRAVVRKYYDVYFVTFADIHILASDARSNLPQYRLLRTLGIDPQQRVFVAQEVGTDRQVVVKWADSANDITLENWEKIRATGVKMLWFDTTYELLDGFQVLVMEKLTPISYRDNPLVLMRDVMQQLAVVHSASSGPFVHSDLKLDNILVRVNEDFSREYFVIDWDGVSQSPWEGIRNAVQRAVRSPIWAAQPSGDNPTSYRYDLQELFYAVVDLFKKIRTYGWRARTTKPVPLSVADADTLIREQFERNITLNAIIQEMHISYIPGYEASRDLFNMILDLPERAPLEQINYRNIIVRLEQSMKNDSIFVGQDYPPVDMASVCVQCERSIEAPLSIKNADGEHIQVCGLKCAALQNPDDYYENALQYKQFAGSDRKPRSACEVCGKTAGQKCICGKIYCGKLCQAEDYLDHKTTCAQRREERLADEKFSASIPFVQ